MALDAASTDKNTWARQATVIALAVLHPRVSPRAVEPFQGETCRIMIRENLDTSGPAGSALIFGGDGTIHRYLTQLRQSRIPALIVPKGSGNDFAKALGIVSERIAVEAWRAFCSTGKNLREIDLGIIQSGKRETLFCCVLGAGLDSVANERANRMPAWLRGSAGYFLAALWSLPSFQPVKLSVSAPMREIRRSGFLIAVANAHRYGRGMKIAPRAQLDDGLLDVCLVGAMSKLKLLAAIPTVFFGAHLSIRQVEYFQAAEVRIDAERPLEIYADGEFACHTPVTIRLLPKALRVIVPPEAFA
ncbi:MAG TPA: diacylglycerol kinase family protein [Terriglobales bacterium]